MGKEQDETKHKFCLDGIWYDSWAEGLMAFHRKNEERKKVEAMTRHAEAMNRFTEALEQQINAHEITDAGLQTTTTHKSLQGNSKPTRGRGRPKETLKDKMIDDADGKKLQKIHTKMCGKKGKDAALIILACMKKGWMAKPTYTQVKDEFGDIGSKAGYNKYLKESMFGKEEIEGAMASLD